MALRARKMYCRGSRRNLRRRRGRRRERRGIGRKGLGGRFRGLGL